MRETSIICPACKELVAVVDKEIADHGECPMAGMRYVPSPAFKAGPGAPSIEVLGTKRMAMACGCCHKEHRGIMVMARVSPGNPSVN